MTSSSSPASSAAIPRLRAEDLPQVPRRLSWMFACDVLFGDVLGVFFAVTLLGCMAAFTAMASRVDARSYDVDCGSAVIASTWENDDNFTVTVRHGADDVVSYVFDEPAGTGARVPLRGDDAGCARVVVLGGKTRPVPIEVLGAMGICSSFALPLLKPLRRRLRRLRLLREGTLTRGKRTGHNVNDEGDWKIHTLSFSFVDDKGRERSVAHTTALPGTLLDEPDEALLYDDDDAAVLDGLPGKPRVKDGALVSSHPIKSAVVALVVVVAVLSVPAGLVVGGLLAWR